ncbi:hypothetical protein COBT_002926, partial [Conglomerata obtusa]
DVTPSLDTQTGLNTTHESYENNAKAKKIKFINFAILLEQDLKDLSLLQKTQNSYDMNVLQNEKTFGNASYVNSLIVKIFEFINHVIQTIQEIQKIFVETNSIISSAQFNGLTDTFNKITILQVKQEIYHTSITTLIEELRTKHNIQDTEIENE